MDGKQKKGTADAQKENASAGPTPPDNIAGPAASGSGGEVDDSEIKELSPEEVSELISPALADENATVKEGEIRKRERFKPKRSLDEGTGNIDLQSNRPAEGDFDRSEQQRPAAEDDNSTMGHVSDDSSPDIESDTGRGETGTQPKPDNSVNLAVEKSSGDRAYPGEPNTEIIVTAEHEHDTPETDSNDNNNEVGSEEEPEQAPGGDYEADEIDNSDRQFNTSHIKTLGAVLAGCLVLVGICGYVLYRHHQPAPLSNLEGTSAVSQIKAPPEKLNHDVAAPAGGSVSSATPQNRLLEIPDQLQKTRNEMLTRAGILIDLQDQYRTGIRRIEEEMLAELRSRNIPSLQQALEEKKIEFQLQTIQRRQAYIDHLEKPVRWLNKGSEELLFLQRKYDIESMVMPVCRDVTSERLIAENDTSMRRFTLGVLQAQLTVDLKSDRYPSLPQIWQNILQKKEKMIASETRPARGNLTGALRGFDKQAKNQVIWSEICTGQFDRKCHLTALSDQAASCLAGWGEPDLFINRVSRLTPGAARNLRKWKGKWLGLNGLVELPPESASYLFTWEGDWVSLNGVMFLAAESSAHLVQWKGKTIELMGLSSELMARDPLALKHLSAWQKKGNNLFVTDEIRQLIESEG